MDGDNKTAIIIVTVIALAVCFLTNVGVNYYLNSTKLYQNQMSAYVAQGYTPQEAECAVNGYSSEACHTLAILSGLKHGGVK